MTHTESTIQKNIRLVTNLTGGLLFRNNSGSAVFKQRGVIRHVRYGLGNDSRLLNAQFKSSDLIGLTPVIIEPRHVGRMFGVFTAVEAKSGNWIYRATERETAQLNFINKIRKCGGIATFASAESAYLNAIIEFLNERKIETGRYQIYTKRT